MAEVIRSEKIIIRSNSCCYPFTKPISRSIGQRHLSESDGIQVFERLGLSAQKELYTAARMAVFV